MKKKKLMIDMDDVITQGGLLYMINKYLNTNYTMDDFQEFYMQNIVHDKENFFEWFKTQNQYDYCELLPDAYEVLKELNEEYELYIATAYIFPELVKEAGRNLQDKYEYLLRELPFISPKQYIFLTNKNILNVDIKIDDKIDNLENCNEKLLFTAYHNNKISKEELNEKGITRVSTWLEIKERLIKNEAKQKVKL